MLKVPTPVCALCFSLQVSVLASPVALASVPVLTSSPNTKSILVLDSSRDTKSVLVLTHFLNTKSAPVLTSSSDTKSISVLDSSLNTKSIPVLASSSDTKSVPVLTPSRDTVSVERAMGKLGTPYQVFLSPGIGVSISVPDGEFIEKVWLDDPSAIVVDANGCLSGLPIIGECKGEATALHLRAIERLNFPGVLVSHSSLLSVMAATGGGKRNIYLFEVIPSARAKQTVFSIAIENPQENPQPVPVAPQVEVRPTAIATLAIERGAAIAASASLYPQNSPIWNRVRDFVSRLKGGQSVRAAAAASGVSLELLYKLQTLGGLSGSNI